MTKHIYTLDAHVRQKTGKGPSRQLRMKSLVPAIVYGKQIEPVSVAVSPKEATKILKSPIRRNAVIKLHLRDSENKEQGTKAVMVRDLQIHPVRRELTHLDFVEIDVEKPVKIVVPIALTGKSEAVTQGAVLEQISFGVHVYSLPTHIPVKIEIDVTPIGLGSFHASDLKLPEGLELAENSNATIFSIHMPRGVEEEAPAPAAEAEAKPAEGAAAAPAPAAKADAKK